MPIVCEWRERCVNIYIITPSRRTTVSTHSTHMVFRCESFWYVFVVRCGAARANTPTTRKWDYNKILHRHSAFGFWIGCRAAHGMRWSSVLKRMAWMDKTLYLLCNVHMYPNNPISFRQRCFTYIRVGRDQYWYGFWFLDMNPNSQPIPRVRVCKLTTN